MAKQSRKKTKSAPPVDAARSRFLARVWTAAEASLTRVVNRAPLSAEDMGNLILFWTLYPGLAQQYRDAAGKFLKLDVQRATAERAIATEAERRGLDSSSVTESGRFCLRVTEDNIDGPALLLSWPECCGENFAKQEDYVKRIIREARATLDRLQAMMYAEAADAQAGAGKTPPTDPYAPYYTPKAFRDRGIDIDDDRLRKARIAGKLHAEPTGAKGKKWRYSYPGAKKLWPESFSDA